MPDSLISEEPIVYDINCDIKQIELVCGEQTPFELVVTNNSPRISTCLISVERELGEEEQSLEIEPTKIKEKKKKSKKKEKPKLVDIQHLEQQDLEARETGVIEFNVITQEQAIAETSKINILLADEKNPDEFYARHTLPLVLKAKPKKSIWRWLKWVLIVIGILIFFLLLALILKPSVIEVPSMVGLTHEEAKKDLEDLGFIVKTKEASYEDLDQTILTSLNEQRKVLIDNMVNPSKKETWSQTIQTAQAFPPIFDKLVFQQTSSEVMEKGSEITLHLVPEIVALPELNHLTTTEASQKLAEQGMRFAIEEAFPSSYTYKTRSQFKNVWGITPTQTMKWEDYWPDVTPSLKYEETEPAQDEPTLVYKGTRVTLKVIPEKIEVPKFTNINLLKLSQFKNFNLVYLFNKNKYTLSDLINQDNIHRKHGQYLYIYSQSAKEKDLVDSQDHQITLSLDTKRL